MSTLSNAPAVPRQRVKSRPGDALLVEDEAAPLAERMSALLRLAVDGDPQAVRVARVWLARPEAPLRAEAVGLLVAVLDNERRQQAAGVVVMGGDASDAVDLALVALREDPDPQVRGAAAIAFQRSTVTRDVELGARIAAVLVERLEHDPDVVLRRTCYETLVEAYGGPAAAIPLDFDPNVHVDWAWVHAHLAR